MFRIFHIEIDILYFIHTNVHEIIWRKSTRKSGRMHIWQLKMQELPGPQGGPWTPANIGLLRSPDSASLRRQNLGKNFWPPP